MLYIPYQGSDRCLHPCITFVTITTVLGYQVPSIHIQSNILGEWCYIHQFDAFKAVLYSSLSMLCLPHQVPCHTKPQKENHSINLSLKMMSSSPAACLWSFSYSRSHTILYQELQLLSIILSPMPLPSSLASLLEKNVRLLSLLSTA